MNMISGTSGLLKFGSPVIVLGRYSGAHNTLAGEFIAREFLSKGFCPMSL
ncbi:MAG TPA: hypothetical protein VIR63_01775 [Pontiella sp.]